MPWDKMRQLSLPGIRTPNIPRTGRTLILTAPPQRLNFSLLRIEWFIIDKTWNLFTQWYIAPSGSGEDDFQISSMYMYFCYLIETLSGLSFLQTSTKNALCKFGWNWPCGYREEDLKFCFVISLSSPLRKGQGPSFEQIWTYFTR